MPGTIPHAIDPTTPFKMLLVMTRGEKGARRLRLPGQSINRTTV
jgi:hypothetical protein